MTVKHNACDQTQLCEINNVQNREITHRRKELTKEKVQVTMSQKVLPFRKTVTEKNLARNSNEDFF